MTLTGHRSILATGLGIAAANHGHRVLFATAVEWVARLQAAHQHGRLAAELAKLRRYSLLIVDEVGYIRLVEYRQARRVCSPNVLRTPAV